MDPFGETSVETSLRVLCCLDQYERVVHIVSIPISSLLKYRFFQCMYGGGFQESQSEQPWFFMVPQLVQLKIGRGKSLAYKYRWAIKIIFENYSINNAESFLCVLYMLEYIDGLSELIRILSSVETCELFTDCMKYFIIWCYSLDQVISDTTIMWLRDVALTLKHTNVKSVFKDCADEEVIQRQTMMVMQVCNQLVFDLKIPLTNVTLNGVLIEFLRVYRAVRGRIPLKPCLNLASKFISTCLINPKTISEEKLATVAYPFSDFYMVHIWIIIHKFIQSRDKTALNELNISGACIAGGSILHAVDSSIPTNDVDIFVYGEPQTSFDLFKTLFTVVYMQYKNLPNFKMMRQAALITFTCEKASMQIIWSGMKTLEETILSFDLCYIQWAYERFFPVTCSFGPFSVHDLSGIHTRTFCTPEALFALYTRQSATTAYMSYCMHQRIEKAEAKGFCVNRDGITPTIPRDWWERYPFGHNIDAVDEYTTVYSVSDSQKRHYDVMCEGFQPIHETIQTLNLHGHLNVGISEFDPYCQYFRGHNGLPISVFNTFCLDLIRVSKITNNYIYCQVDLQTFDKIYSDEFPMRRLLLANIISNSRYEDLAILDDEGFLVLPLYVQQTKIHDAEFPNTIQILAMRQDHNGEIVNNIQRDLTSHIKIGDYLSVTVCTREIWNCPRLHAVNIWIYRQNSKIVQSMVRLTGLKPHKVKCDNDMLFHPLYNMDVPTKEVKEKFCEWISTSKSVLGTFHFVQPIHCDIMAYRGMRKYLSNSSRKDKPPHWYFNYLRDWIDTYIRVIDEINPQLIETVETFLETHTKTFIEFDDFKKVFESHCA